MKTQRMMKSYTYGKVNLRQIVEIIAKRTEDQKGDYFVTIGTDSQNTSYTKIVSVIAVYGIRESGMGTGGFFFYETEKRKLMPTVREKLLQETELSLELADQLIREFEDYYDETEFDYTDLTFSIHVDAGPNGKSSEMIPEVIGWVKSLGYDCDTKPNAFVASSIADRISK